MDTNTVLDMTIEEAIPLNTDDYDHLAEPIEAFNYDKGFRDAVQQALWSMRVEKFPEEAIERVIDTLLQAHHDSHPLNPEES